MTNSLIKHQEGYDFPRVLFPWERHLYLENGTPSIWPTELDAHCTCESLQQWQYFSFASGDLLLIWFSISPFILYDHSMPSSFWYLLKTVSKKTLNLPETASVSENRIWITPLRHSIFWTNTLDEWIKLLKWSSDFFFWLFFSFHSALQGYSISS